MRRAAPAAWLDARLADGAAAARAGNATVVLEAPGQLDHRWTLWVGRLGRVKGTLDRVACPGPLLGTWVDAPSSIRQSKSFPGWGLSCWWCIGHRCVSSLMVRDQSPGPATTGSGGVAP